MQQLREKSVWQKRAANPKLEWQDTKRSITARWLDHILSSTDSFISLSNRRRSTKEGGGGTGSHTESVHRSSRRSTEDKDERETQ